MADIVRPAVKVGEVTLIVNTTIPPHGWVSTERVVIEITPGWEELALVAKVRNAAEACLEAGLRAIAGKEAPEQTGE